MATRKRRTPVKRKATNTRRRRRTTKKKGMLSEMFSRGEAESGFKQALGVGAGFVASEYATQWINPDGDKNHLEIGVKMVGGFLVSTTGRMPSVGAGIMASGFKKILCIQQGGTMCESRVNYLSEAPKMIDTGRALSENEMQYLSQGYSEGYESNEY